VSTPPDLTASVSGRAQPFFRGRYPGNHWPLKRKYDIANYTVTSDDHARPRRRPQTQAKATVLPIPAYRGVRHDKTLAALTAISELQPMSGTSHA
jgi:hypothetical protein